MQSSSQKDIKESLNEKPGFQVWWRLLRPHTLTASFVPVFIGTALAYNDGAFHVLLFFAMLLASMLIQAATNMFNEYYDFTRGLDNEESVGIGGTIVRDGIAAKTVLRLALSFFVIAMLLGVYICLQSSWWICLIGLVCMLFGYLYTGGPFPIAYTPFGELSSGLLMGTVIIGISYYIQAGTITGSVVLATIPTALFIGGIMMANNIRDLDGDKANGRKTIAILLGHTNAVRFLGALFTIAFVLTAVYIIGGLLPVWAIITFISMIKAIDVLRKFHGKSKPIEMLPAMVATGKTNTIYGFLLGIALLLDRLF